ncbi:MAG: hypothetical protein KJ578_03680 [Bacteroidetes bacterium]|nr:hypothetical protein [Bacteroidota bacterium]MBU1578061.1 hypothetical protein [Bacteroidota bacterium]MBU2556861.1 hypothetical protein [Bacteroidota bacterium]
MKQTPGSRFTKAWFLGATVVSLILLVVFLVSIVIRRFNGDEGIIGEWAYWLAKNGEARSMLYYSYFGEKALSLPIYHKFYTILLSGMIEVFGFQLFFLRIPSLLAFGGIILLSSIYLRDKKVELFPWYIILGFFLSQSLVFNFAFVARPELLMAFLALAVFISLRKFSITKDWRWALSAGIISGLSFYTHLNGLAIIAAAGLFLLFHFQWKAIFAFGLSAFALASLFVVDIPGTYMGLLNELSQAPDVKNSSFSLGRVLMKIVYEHERFFHNAGLAVFSLATFLSLAFTWKQQYKQNSDLLIFTILLVFSLSLITHGKTPKYMLIYIPFMGLIILHAIHFLLSAQSKIKLLVLSLFLVAGAGISIGNYLKDYPYFVAVEARNQAMGAQMVKGATVLAHNGFVFGQMEQFEIRSPIVFFFTNEGFTKNEYDDSFEYLNFARKENYDYVAIDLLLERKEIREIFDDERFRAGDSLAGYKLFYKDADFMVFKRLKTGNSGL